MYIHDNRLSDFYLFQKQKILAFSNFAFASQTAVCQKQIFGIFAGDRCLSVANVPTFCYWQTSVSSTFPEYLLLTHVCQQPLRCIFQLFTFWFKTQDFDSQCIRSWSLLNFLICQLNGVLDSRTFAILLLRILWSSDNDIIIEGGRFLLGFKKTDPIKATFDVRLRNPSMKANKNHSHVT